MTSLFSHSVRSEMLALFVAESCAVALLVLACMTFGGASDVGPAAATALLVALCAMLVAGATGLYRPSVLPGLLPSRVQGVTAAALLAALLALLLLVLPFGHGPWGYLELLSVVWAATLVGMVATRLVFRLLNFPLPRLAVVGAAEAPGVVRRNYQPFEVMLALPVGENLLDAVERGRLRAWRVWAVVSSGAMPLAAAESRRCGAAGVQVFTEAEFSEHGLHRLDVEGLPKGWLASANATRESAVSAGLRRAFDIFFALALLTLTLPLLLLTMLAIRLDGPGPIFYRQERVGRDNRVFELLKFRSMIPNAETGMAVWAGRGDTRVTRVGRILRLCRIDEIPQAINVLRGDMSIIGPRPERPTFVKQLAEAIPHYNDRAVIRPGITGWAQVNYPYGASVEDARMKLSYDLYYIRRRSLFLDLLILLATVRVVLFQEGAR